MPENEENENDSEGIKNLRKQFETQAKELKELREYREQRELAERTGTVADVLKARGVPPAAAKFYDGEDTSEDAIGKWLNDNADIFGVKPQEQSAENQNAERVINSSFGTPVPVDNGLTEVPLGDIEKRRELLRTLSNEECVRIGLIPQL